MKAINNVVFPLFILITLSSCINSKSNVEAHFELVRDDPILLRQFLKSFPKGGDIHNHLTGAIYAESYLGWAAEDGKCIDLEQYKILLPPCDAPKSVLVADFLNYYQVGFDEKLPNVDSAIDAMSTRNYQTRSISGHDQFFSTFDRFFIAAEGRRGDMLAEVTSRASTQNILYLELMQSLGMFEVASVAASNTDLRNDFGDRLDHFEVDKIAKDVIQTLDQIETRQREILNCGFDAKVDSGNGCNIKVRYLAQVIRTLTIEQVYAQTLLAFKLMKADERIVGLNFVAPEDNSVSLRDYKKHMQFIKEISNYFPDQKDSITLHAGELVLGLVPPKHLGWHIRDAIFEAGASRIGHGIDIMHDKEVSVLLDYMAENEILVEINLTSNEVILEVSGKDHPLNIYMENSVPIALSTDDEGVSRIDLTHEYQKAVETFDISYKTLKTLSRNSLQYSFLEGESIFLDTSSGILVKPCKDYEPENKMSESCSSFLANNEKAFTQIELERRFMKFEDTFN